MAKYWTSWSRAAEIREQPKFFGKLLKSLPLSGMPVEMLAQQ